MIDVSLIIVNFNASDYLEVCLNSVQKETKGVSYEVIVVDNGSANFNLESWQKKYAGTTFIINNINKGFAAANNDGLKYATGKYVLFLNNDTRLIENTIKRVFDFAEKLSKPAFIGCQLLNDDLSKQESVVCFPDVWNGFTENFFLYKLFPQSKFFNKYYQNNKNWEIPIKVDVIRGAFMFCPANAIKELNGFDDRFFFYSEETDLCYRFNKIGGETYFLPDVKLIHYGGITADKNLWFKFKNQTIGKIQYYQKHFFGIRFTTVIMIHFIGLFLRGLLNTITGIILFRKRMLLKGHYFFKQIFVYPKNVFTKPIMK